MWGEFLLRLFSFFCEVRGLTCKADKAVLDTACDWFVPVEISLAVKNIPRIPLINFSKPVWFLDIQRPPFEISKHQEITFTFVSLVFVFSAVYVAITADFGDVLSKHFTAQFENTALAFRVRKYALLQMFPSVSDDSVTSQVYANRVPDPFPFSYQGF